MIGFYVHHQGRGHLTRARAIIGQLDSEALVMTSLPVDQAEVAGAHLVALPPDAQPGDASAQPTARGALHWAPEASNLLRRRSAVMMSTFSDVRLSLVVCDVSVEAALLARLCGVPAVSVRSHGDRSDRPHRLGYDISTALLAPFPASMESLGTPSEVTKRSYYSGFVTSASAAESAKGQARSALGFDRATPILLIAVGAGGHSFEASNLTAICEALEGWTVVFAGAAHDTADHRRLKCIGWSNELSTWMAAADIVAGHGGANTVAEVAAANRPFICVAEDRPFSEQRYRATRLAQLGAAITPQRWPEPEQWPKTVRDAQILGSRTLHELAAKDGAVSAAAWLDRLHDGLVAARR